MKRWLWILFQVISLIAFGLILWWSGPETWNLILSAEPSHFLYALIFRGIAGFCATTRLSVMAQTMSGQKQLSWRRLYNLNMTARALGIVLPRGISVLGGKSVALRSFGIPLRRALWIIMVDNTFDIAFLFLLLVPAIIYLQWKVAVSTLLLLTGIILLIALIAVWLGLTERIAPLLVRLRNVDWVARRLKLDKGADVLILPPSRPSLQALGITILLNTALIFSFYNIGRTVGIDTPWHLYSVVFPLTQLSLVLSVTPGGLGTYDFTWLGLLILVGMSQTEANTFAVAQRVYVIVFVLFWAGVSALLGLTAEKPAIPPEIEYHPDNKR